MYFPGWKVIAEGEIIESKPTGDYGVITVNLPEGRHMVKGRFENTLVRNIGNALTLITVLILFGGAILKHNKKKLLWL